MLINIMVPAGMELVFFITAHMVLCFGFMSKPTLVTHQCLAIAEQCLHSIKGLFFLLCTPKQVGQEVGRGYEGTQPVYVTQNDQRNIPYCIMLSGWMFSCCLGSTHHNELTGFDTEVNFGKQQVPYKKLGCRR